MWNVSHLESFFRLRLLSPLEPLRRKDLVGYIGTHDRNTSLIWLCGALKTSSSSEITTIIYFIFFKSHFRDCCCGSTEGGEVEDDLWEVSDVAGPAEVEMCRVLGFSLGIMGPAAWDPHTFSTWGRDSSPIGALEKLVVQIWTVFSHTQAQIPERENSGAPCSAPTCLISGLVKSC